MEINGIHGAENGDEREDSPVRTSPKAKNARRAQFSSCSTRMTQRCFKNYWSVENFNIQLELHNPGEFMLAPKFGDCDYEFVMKLFPNGKDEETSGYLSLFLLINKCPNPRLRFRVSFTVETGDGPRSCQLNKNLVTINRSGIVTASKFFSLDILKSAPTVYTPNDILTIGCDLTIFGESLTWPTNLFGHPYARANAGKFPPLPPNMSAVEEQPSTAGSVKDAFPDGFHELLSSGDFADFTVVSSCGREFKTHMCVLSARSDYFKALLRNKSTVEYVKKRVRFPDISGPVLEIILRHIYSSATTSEEDALKDYELTPELITAVDRLMVTSMRTEIAEILTKNVSAENIASRLSMASELRLEEPYQIILEHFVNHKRECVKSAQWQNLRAEKPALTIKILEDAFLSVTECNELDRRIIDRITIS